MCSPPLWYSYGLKMIGIDGITHFIRFFSWEAEKTRGYSPHISPLPRRWGLGPDRFFQLERGNSRNERIDMFLILSLPILDTLQKNNFFAGERRYSHQYQKTKGLKYPCKIDLEYALVVIIHL